jgi:hypothetical protein
VRKAAKVVEEGYRFEAEVLSDEVTVSLTCAGYHPELEEEHDIAHVLRPNGPTIPDAVVTLVAGAYQRLIEWGKISATA